MHSGQPGAAQAVAQTEAEGLEAAVDPHGGGPAAAGADQTIPAGDGAG